MTLTAAQIEAKQAALLKVRQDLFSLIIVLQEDQTANWIEGANLPISAADEASRVKTQEKTLLAQAVSDASGL